MEAQKPLEQETPETTPQEAPTATIPQPESTPAANPEADPIPEEMDESYRRYLELQAAQGFDLERYAGRRIRRYTYEVTNYPTGESGVQANLMLYRTTVVGGEVLSPRMDGFVHGLIDCSSDAQSTS